MSSSETGFMNKIKKIAVEIIVIVFSISLSLALQNWNVSRNNVTEEKEFLLGLKEDLKVSISNIESSKLFYQQNLSGINYFLRAGRGDALVPDSINKYSGLFFNSTELDPHIGRYEGFKNSGKFAIVQNRDLLNNIISLHESIYQRIQHLNEKHFHQVEKMEALISAHVLLGANGEITNASEIVTRSDFKILLSSNLGLTLNNIIPVHQAGIDKGNEIIQQIENELK